MQKITGRCALHYGVTLSLFCLYGLQVCPFLESLTLPQLLGPTLLVFAIMFAVRDRVLHRLVLPGSGLGGFALEVGFYLLGACCSRATTASCTIFRWRVTSRSCWE